MDNGDGTCFRQNSALDELQCQLLVPYSTVRWINANGIAVNAFRFASMALHLRFSLRSQGPHLQFHFVIIALHMRWNVDSTDSYRPSSLPGAAWNLINVRMKILWWELCDGVLSILSIVDNGYSENRQCGLSISHVEDKT